MTAAQQLALYYKLQQHLEHSAGRGVSEGRHPRTGRPTLRFQSERDYLNFLVRKQHGE